MESLLAYFVLIILKFVPNKDMKNQKIETQTLPKKK